MGFRFLQILSEYKPKVTDDPADKIVLAVGIFMALVLFVWVVITIHDSGRDK